MSDLCPHQMSHLGELVGTLTRVGHVHAGVCARQDGAANVVGELLQVVAGFLGGRVAELDGQHRPAAVGPDVQDA